MHLLKNTTPTFPPTSTVTMSNAQPKFVSINGTYITLSKSDGDPSLLPEVEEEVIDSKGNVDYLGEAEEEVAKAWLLKTGCYLVYEGDWYEPRESGSYLLATRMHYLT